MFRPRGLWPYLLSLGALLAATLAYHKLRLEKLTLEKMVMKYEEKRLEFLREPTPQFEEMTAQNDSHGASGWLGYIA